MCPQGYETKDKMIPREKVGGEGLMGGCGLGRKHSLGRRCLPGDGGGDGVGENTFLKEKMRPWGHGAKEKTFRRWA
jgi:hypothetical protein